MTRAALFVVALATLAPALASAQPPVTTFTAPVTYQRCSESWAFACNQRDASGRTFGTASPVTMCTTYRFASDGTVDIAATIGRSEPARYRLEGDQVHIEWLDDDGRVRHEQTLRLGEGGRTLGDLRRLEPTPPPAS